MAAAAAALAGLSLAGAYMDSVALSEQAASEELNARLEADVLRTNARLRIKAGDEEAHAFMKKAARFKGEQRAALAASGVSVDYGSAAQIQEETAIMAAQDAERIKNNATMEAFGYKSKANQLELQGRVTGAGLRAKAGATLLGGAAKAGAQAYSYGKMTVPGGAESSGWTGSSTGSSYNTSEDIA